jgi:hypothetical protein
MVSFDGPCGVAFFEQDGCKICRIRTDASLA